MPLKALWRIMGAGYKVLSRNQSASLMGRKYQRVATMYSYYRTPLPFWLGRGAL